MRAWKHTRRVSKMLSLETLLFLKSRSLFMLGILLSSFCWRSSSLLRTLFVDSLQRLESNTLWSIWTLSFESLIIVVSFHGFFFYFFCLTYKLNLYKGDVHFNELRWYRHTLLFKDLNFKDIWHVPYWLASKVIREFEHLYFPFSVFL
jgi:hypothetical protein